MWLQGQSFVKWVEQCIAFGYQTNPSGANTSTLLGALQDECTVYDSELHCRDTDTTQVQVVEMALVGRPRPRRLDQKPQ